jgi:hypothetical protein
VKQSVLPLLLLELTPLLLLLAQQRMRNSKLQPNRLFASRSNWHYCNRCS